MRGLGAPSPYFGTLTVTVDVETFPAVSVHSTVIV
jgi:hypothetical protein